MLIVVALVAALSGPTAHRSSAVTAAFERTHPCPANGLKTGPCPGWIKDHIMPLCANGPDAISNLQWQTIQAAKLKDQKERQQCAALKAALQVAPKTPK